MEILNARINNVSLTMRDHGMLCYEISVDIADGTACSIGGYKIGSGYLGAKEFVGWDKGIEALMRIMDTVGVSRWEDLNGKYIRVKSDGWGSVISCFGNIMKDKWFDQKKFFGGD